MSVPFAIIKRAGRESRFTFNETPIDDYLDGQALRDIYFQLSGQSYKVGQGSSKAFPRKGDLIQECERLITSYMATPALWEAALANQEKKMITREKAAAKKAAKAAALQARIDEQVAILSAMSDEDFEILQKAMAVAAARSRSADSDTE